MTDPLVDNDVVLDDVDHNEGVQRNEPVRTDLANSASSDNVVLRCAGMTTLFTDPDGRFPDITDSGTEMTQDQAKAAKEAARHSGLQLRTVRGDR